MRQETGQSLLTKGYFFDQGVRPTPKAEGVALYQQGMDETEIAFHTHHAQSSVGRYLRDYQRVKLLLNHQVDIDQLSPMIDMQPSVVKAYVNLSQQSQPDFLDHLEPISQMSPSGA